MVADEKHVVGGYVPNLEIIRTVRLGQDWVGGQDQAYSSRPKGARQVRRSMFLIMLPRPVQCGFRPVVGSPDPRILVAHFTSDNNDGLRDKLTALER